MTDTEYLARRVVELDTAARASELNYASYKGAAAFGRELLNKFNQPTPDAEAVVVEEPEVVDEP